MCHSLTPLVTHAPRRRVLQCSCGTRHVVWENLNLSLQEDDLRDLLTLVRGREESAGHWHLHRGAGSTGLWYGPLGTTFSPADFADFVRLLQNMTTAYTPPPRSALN